MKSIDKSAVAEDTIWCKEQKLHLQAIYDLVLEEHQKTLTDLLQSVETLIYEECEAMYRRWRLNNPQSPETVHVIAHALQDFWNEGKTTLMSSVLRQTKRGEIILSVEILMIKKVMETQSLSKVDKLAEVIKYLRLFNYNHA